MMTIPAYGTTAINHIIYRELGSRLRQTANGKRQTWICAPPPGGGVLQDFNRTPKELKTERDCSHRQLFRPLWGSSVWRNNQRSGSDEKISAHSDFSPDLELLTPTESRHTTCLLGGKSPSVKLMSRRENKELAKTNLKNMDKTTQKLQHIGSIKDTI